MKQHFCNIYGYLLEFTGLTLPKFYLLKCATNVYQLALKVNITTVFYTPYTFWGYYTETRKDSYSTDLCQK